MKQQLELSLSVNPELLTAEAIYQILKLPSAIKVETFSSSRMEMVELYLPQNTAVEGVSLGELRKNSKPRFWFRSSEEATRFSFRAATLP